MMTMKNQRSHSSKRLHQDQLRQLEARVGNKLDDLLDHFSLRESLKKSKRFWVGGCPVHGGDKSNAFNIFHTGNEVIGNWRCFTHNCHKHFQPTVLGFIRGVISHAKYGWRDTSDRDKECPFPEALQFAGDFIGEKNIGGLKIDYEAFEKKRFASQIERIYSREEPAVTHKIPKETVRRSLEIPAMYYLSRGYTEEILDKYDIGICTTPGREMTMRAVVPIYDQNYQHVVACSGRSVFDDKCPLCESYHNPIKQCPSERDRWKYAKWRHSYGFKGEFHLYNYWFAKQYIAKSGIVILVEGPGDVWRLEEAGIHNSVATFGAHITEGQRAILDKSGALAIVALTDPDEAGRLALAQIREECGRSYGIYAPKVNGGDMGETEVATIKEKLIPQLEEIQQGLGL